MQTCFCFTEPQDNDNNVVKQTKSLIKFRDPSNVEVKLDMSGNGMEFLSVAAGVTAKDKRTKDIANQAAAMKDGSSSCLPRVTSKKMFMNYSDNQNNNCFLQKWFP